MSEKTTVATMPIHLTGMTNTKGQQTINSILDNINNEIDTHKWTVTTQDYARLKFEKYLESGATLYISQAPQTPVPVVGTHNNRKVYIGTLDTDGNMTVTDLALRDNITQAAKSWEVRSTADKTTSLQGDYWNSETFGVGIRNPLLLKEVESIPNDISDTTYGSTIYNKLTTTTAGTKLDTKTFEKTEYSIYITYPTITTKRKDGDGNIITTNTYALEQWVTDWWKSIGTQTYFPQITTQNAKACWAPGQVYGVFEWVNGAPGRIKLDSYTAYSTYDDYYAAVAAYPSTNGESGTGIMIPSWQAIKLWYNLDCTAAEAKIITRRFISEDFDSRNSGVVKVDICYRA